MKRVIPGTTLCEGWTWLDAGGNTPIASDLFTSQRMAIHQAEGCQDQVVYAVLMLAPPPGKKPKTVKTRDGKLWCILRSGNGGCIKLIKHKRKEVGIDLGVQSEIRLTPAMALHLSIALRELATTGVHEE